MKDFPSLEDVDAYTGHRGRNPVRTDAETMADKALLELVRQSPEGRTLGPAAILDDRTLEESGTCGTRAYLQWLTTKPRANKAEMDQEENNMSEGIKKAVAAIAGLKTKDIGPWWSENSLALALKSETKGKLTGNMAEYLKAFREDVRKATDLYGDDIASTEDVVRSHAEDGFEYASWLASGRRYVAIDHKAISSRTSLADTIAELDDEKALAIIHNCEQKIADREKAGFAANGRRRTRQQVEAALDLLASRGKDAGTEESRQSDDGAWEDISVDDGGQEADGSQDDGKDAPAPVEERPEETQETAQEEPPAAVPCRDGEADETITDEQPVQADEAQEKAPEAPVEEADGADVAPAEGQVAGQETGQAPLEMPDAVKAIMATFGALRIPEAIMAAASAARDDAERASRSQMDELRKEIAGTAGNARLDEQEIHDTVAAAVEKHIAEKYGSLPEKVDVGTFVTDGKTVVKPFDRKLRHKDWDKVMRIIGGCHLNVYLSGPSGCGKSYLVRQIADDLGIPFYSESGIQDSYTWKGFVDAGGTYHPSSFYLAYKDGGIYFVDEMDSSSPRELVAMNNAIDSERFTFPGGETVERNGSFHVVGAGNTLCVGASEMYAGRRQLDLSTFDRFVFVSMDYDPKIDQALSDNNLPLARFASLLREAIGEAGKTSDSGFALNTEVSSRQIMQAASLIRHQAVATDRELISCCFLKGVREDDLAMVRGAMADLLRDPRMTTVADVRNRFCSAFIGTAVVDAILAARGIGKEAV